VKLSVGAAAFQDDAGNDSTAGAEVSTIHDGSAPTVTIGNLIATGNGTWTSAITLSEAAGSGTAFELADLALTNATATLTGSGTSFTATLTPLADGYVQLSVQPGAFKDAAGNDNAPTQTASIIVDITPPVIAPLADVLRDTDLGKATASVDVTGMGTAFDSSLPPIAGKMLHAIGVSVAVEYYVGKNKLNGPYDFPLGETMVYMSAVDDAGNRAESVSFKVIVSDKEAPTLVTPQDQSIATAPGRQQRLLMSPHLGRFPMILTARLRSRLHWAERS